MGKGGEYGKTPTFIVCGFGSIAIFRYNLSSFQARQAGEHPHKTPNRYIIYKYISFIHISYNYIYNIIDINLGKIWTCVDDLPEFFLLKMMVTTGSP
jgi:hypothetical protein